MSWCSRASRLLAVRALVVAAGLAGGAANASVDGGRFGSMTELLTSAEFIDDCIGREGGTIWLSFSPTYPGESRALAEQMRRELRATGAAREVNVRTFPDWDAAADCDSSPTRGPRAVVFVQLFKDGSGAIQTARVVVRSNDECRAAVLSRGQYPKRCDEVRGARLVAPKSLPTLQAGDAISGRRPQGVSPMLLRQRARDRTTGLLTGAVIEAGFVVGLRVTQGAMADDSVNVDILGGLAYTSTLGLAALAGVTAKSWMVRVPLTRRRRVGLGVGGGVLVALGGASIAAMESLTRPGLQSAIGNAVGLRLVQAVAELSAAAGVGLVTFAVHHRVALSPSLAGLTVSGRF